MTPFCTPWLGPRRLIAASSSTPATMATTPAATPSEPSRRLIDVCMPTIHTTVIGAARMPRSRIDVECVPGRATKAMVIPTAATSAPAPVSIPSLVHQGRSSTSSTSMATVIAAHTAMTSQRWSTGEPNAASAMAKPAKSAMPPSRGVGSAWM